MGRRALLLAAVGLALLSWLPLGLAGVPLDTPDGFLHLGWAVAWAKAVQGGWLWPTWSDLPWAGAGSSALLMYPPLFRQIVGGPILLGVPPDLALAAGLLVVLMVHNTGVAALGNLWIPRARWRLVLLVGAALNPYLLVNLYVRGAWPEALAQGMLWWLGLGFWGLDKGRRWGCPLAGVALAAIVLSNWNAALLTGATWLIAGFLLIRRRACKRWLWSCALGLGLSMPFWLPALLALPTVRPPMPIGLLPGEFFGSEDHGYQPFAALLWIQALAITLLGIWRWVGWRGRGPSAVGRWGTILAVSSVLMTLTMSEPIYDVITPLQRIQFPWRWLGIGWFGVLLMLGSAGEASSRRWQGRSTALWLIGVAAAGCWVDGLWRFRSNLWGHSPSHSESVALRKLLECDPLMACPAGVNALPQQGELAKRFVALPDGRIALSGVPDYSPATVPEQAWNRRLAIFWLPAWPQKRWAQLNVPGNVEIASHGPRHRIITASPLIDGELRIMQWAHNDWRISVYAEDADGKGTITRSIGTKESRDENGWIWLPLKKGKWRILLQHGWPH